MNQSHLEDLLRSALEECEQLRAENAHLRMMLGIPNLTSAESSQTTIPIEVGESSNAEQPAPEKTIALFRSPFHGREDVYAVRWEGRNWQVRLFSRRCHGLARNPRRKGGGSQGGRTEDANASALNDTSGDGRQKLTSTTRDLDAWN
jgi:regulator of replication initiation timing